MAYEVNIFYLSNEKNYTVIIILKSMKNVFERLPRSRLQQTDAIITSRCRRYFLTRGVSGQWFLNTFHSTCIKFVITEN